MIRLMTIWEYAILDYGIRPAARGASFPDAVWMEPGQLQEYQDRHIHYLLGQAGAQGWELVSTHVADARLPLITYTFKRPR